MEKIKEIELRTKRYSFTIEVFRDDNFEDFLATIDGFTPPLAQETWPGASVTYMTPTQTQEFRDKDKETLIKGCRAWIRQLDGEILVEREV